MNKEKDKKHFLNFRNLEIQQEKFVETDEDYTFTVSFASKQPYERWFGFEIIKTETMDLSRLNNNAPVLFNHDKNKVIGVVLKAYVKNEIAYADIRLSKTNEDSVKVYNLIKEGILKKVSFGYEYKDSRFLGTENNIESYEFDVLPFEVSIVSIPADDTVGIVEKREFSNYISNKKQMEIKQMPTKENKEEISETEEIAELGRLTNMQDLALRFIEEKRSLEDFKKEIAKNKSTKINPTNENDMTTETKNTKSLGSEVLQLLRDKQAKTIKASDYREYNGFKVENYGKELHKTTFAEIASNIKHENILTKIGFDIRDGVVGDLVIPVLSEAPEGITQTEGSVSIEGKAFKTDDFRIEKETFTLPIKHSYELAKQTDEYIQTYLIEEGLKAYYTQVGNKILSKLLKEVILTQSLNGTSISYADVVGIQDKSWTGENEGKFLISKKLLNQLKTVTKFEHTATPIFDGQTIDGESYVVNKVKPSELGTKEFMVYGDFSKFVVALFGYPDIYINPYPDDKNRFEIKFIGMYGAKLTNPSSLVKMEIDG